MGVDKIVSLIQSRDKSYMEFESLVYYAVLWETPTSIDRLETGQKSDDGLVH